MFGKRITLFRLFGFEVRIDASWIIIVVLITWSLAKGVFPVYYKGLSNTTYWWMGIAGSLGLFISIVLHELSHSLVARRFGLPMRGITLFIFGGVAEMDDEPPGPKAEFFMAAAGPLASIVLGFIFWGLTYLGKFLGWSVPPVVLFSYLGTINFVLAIFNLLPAFPLDGGRIFRSILWNWKKNINWATKVSSQVGSGFGLFLIFLGIFSVFAGGLIGGIWWALIGLFLRNASKMSYQNVLVKGALEGERVEKFMQTEPVVVASDLTIGQLVSDYIYKYHFKMFPVVKDSRALCCINMEDIKNIPEKDWGNHSVGEIAKPCSEDNSISVNENAIKALTVMNRTGNNRLMVLGGAGELVGMISMKDLVKFLSSKLELNEDEVPKNSREDE
jgi:Zn-dependent protease